MGEPGIVLIDFEFLYTDTCTSSSFSNSVDVKYLSFCQLKIWCAGVAVHLMSWALSLSQAKYPVPIIHDDVSSFYFEQ